MSRDHLNSGDTVRTLLDAAPGIFASLAALAYLLGADYPPAALGALVAIFFAAYLWMRVMVFWENDRFSPKRIRVGMTWAFIGVHADTQEYDPRPVRVYFALLAILFAGLILRPFVDWMIS